MHRIRIFMNPRASGSDRPVWIREIRRQLFRSELEFVEAETQDELLEELDRTRREQVDAVVSIGGDGTVNTLIQGLGGSSIPFLVIPAGTANDFARELGIVGRVEKAVRCIRTSSPSKIDLIRVNGRFMATNGGLGLASAVALSINGLRQKFPAFRSLMGLMSDQVYSLALAAHLVSPSLDRIQLELRAPGRNKKTETYLLMINNQPTLGGRFCVAPTTSNRDGKFNVSLFQHQSRAAFTGCAMRIRMGRDVRREPEVLSFETDRLEILLEPGSPPQPFFGDGEILCEDTRFEISIESGALLVYQVDRRRFPREKAG